MDLIQKLLSGTKDVLIIGFIFLLFSLPQFDELLKKGVFANRQWKADFANANVFIKFILQTINSSLDKLIKNSNFVCNDIQNKI